MKNIWIALWIALASGCSKSLVYSPSINLTNQPLKEKELDVQGCLELLPETRPNLFNGIQSTMGISGQLAYGFSNKFNLSIKGWVDIEKRESTPRSGYSLNGQFIRFIDDRNRIIVLPRVGIALNSNEIAGYGLGTSIVYQNSICQKFSWYGGVGLLWGFRYLTKDLNAENDKKIPMGFGILGNLGTAWKLSKSIRLNCEVNPIFQINTFENNTQILLSPSIGVGYTLIK